MAESNREGSLATALADSILGEVTPQKKDPTEVGPLYQNENLLHNSEDAIEFLVWCGCTGSGFVRTKFFLS